MTGYLDAAGRYFAEWVDVEPGVFCEGGVSAVRSAKRDVRQKGYSRAFDLYCVIADAATVISYGSRLEGVAERVVEVCEEGAEVPELVDRLNEILPGRVGHSLKFSYGDFPDGIDASQAPPGRVHLPLSARRIRRISPSSSKRAPDAAHFGVMTPLSRRKVRSQSSRVAVFLKSCPTSFSRSHSRRPDQTEPRARFVCCRCSLRAGSALSPR